MQFDVRDYDIVHERLCQAFCFDQNIILGWSDWTRYECIGIAGVFREDHRPRPL